MELRFNGNTAEELNTQIKDYLSKLKGTRGGKNTGDDEGAQTGGQAPAPLQPPAGGTGGFATGAAGFAPPVGGAAPMGGGFPAAGATGPAPEVAALVNRIVARLEGAIASGQPADAAWGWLRGQCGPEAASYSPDQLKTIALPKQPVAVLENVAKLMAA